MLLHVSRGVRWDSDHVVCWDAELQAIASEIIRNGWEKRVHIGLDYFDASINRMIAWSVGMRNTCKALLFALLEPAKLLADAEKKRDFGGRLMLMEESKNLPFAPVWNEYCRRCGAPDGFGALESIRKYECEVLSKRK